MINLLIASAVVFVLAFIFCFFAYKENPGILSEEFPEHKRK